MSYTQQVFEHICNRAKEKHTDELGTRLYRFDGLMRDFVNDQRIPAGELCLRYGLLQTSPATLQGASKPKLLTMEISLDLVVTSVTAQNRDAKYKIIDDLMDSFSLIFTPGQLNDPTNWSLEDKSPITAVDQGPIIPNVTVDYISRGFQLNLKVLV